MLSWIQIVFYIIINLPKLIGLIKQIIELIKGAPVDQVASLKQQLSDAIEHHKKTKDPSKIIAVCEGVGCVSDVKSE